MNFRRIWPYWGLIALVIAVTGWLTANIGPGGLSLLFALSFVWFLLQAPLPCGAPIRQQGLTCRNNARGLLRGCRVEQHKWQRLRSLFVRPRLARVTRELFPNALTGLATVGALATLVSTVVTTVVTLLGGGDA